MNECRRSPGSQVALLNAVVLGGGGPVGVSWTSALLHGLVSAGLPLAKCDVVLGTSAGAAVGAWLTMRPGDLPTLPERMRARAAWHADNAASGYGDRSLLRRAIARSGQGTDSTLSLAQAAIAAIPPISVDQAEALWRAMLPEGPWSRQLRMVSVNAATGLARVWSADDDVSLAVAVSCSTAAPGAAPPVAVAGSVWVDGVIRSGTNADLLVGIGGDDGHDRASYAAGPGKVLVVAPIPADDLAREAAILVERGYRVRVIIAQPFYTAPKDLFDLRFIDVATAAGMSQAREIAADLMTWWAD
jgi:NTE family protein